MTTKKKSTLTIRIADATAHDAIGLCEAIALLCETFTEATGVETTGTLSVEGCNCPACASACATDATDAEPRTMRRPNTDRGLN